MTNYYRKQIILRDTIKSVAIIGYTVLATLAYGHSYANSEYQKYPGYELLSTYRAGAAAILAPAYWLSIAGVWVFEGSAETKILPNPFGGN